MTEQAQGSHSPLGDSLPVMSGVAPPPWEAGRSAFQRKSKGPCHQEVPLLRWVQVGEPVPHALTTPQGARRCNVLHYIPPGPLCSGGSVLGGQGVDLQVVLSRVMGAPGKRTEEGAS